MKMRVNEEMMIKEKWRGTLTCNRRATVLEGIRKMLALRELVVSWYVQLPQRLTAGSICVVVVVVEIGCIDDIEHIMSRGTPIRMRVGEGRLPKSLLTVKIGHYSPWAA
jgi:hypothetical protein